MWLRIAALLGVMAAGARAGESDDVRQIPMQPAGTVTVVDHGKAPQSVLAFHFKEKTKRTLRTRTEGVAKSYAHGKGDKQRQPMATQETTYAVQVAVPAGDAMITITSGDVHRTVSVSAKGQIISAAPDLPKQIAQVAGLPILLPEEPIGAGAHWLVFQRIPLLGREVDAVTSVSLVSRDGDRAVLHMIRDLRVDGKTLAAMVGSPDLVPQEMVTQDIAHMTLDLSSPALISDTTVLSVVYLTGMDHAQRADYMFLKSISTDVMGESHDGAALTRQLLGKWTQSWAGLTMTATYAEGGTMVLHTGGGDRTLPWQVDGEGHLTNKPLSDDASHAVAAGEYWIDWFDGGEILWRRAAP